jgi:hypothetical protein
MNNTRISLEIKKLKGIYRIVRYTLLDQKERYKIEAFLMNDYDLSTYYDFINQLTMIYFENRLSHIRCG